MVGRKGDIVMEVCQDNANRTLTITRIDDSQIPLAQLVGYQPDELAGKDLMPLLPPQITDNIANYLEFEENGNDLATVLGKSRGFGMKHKEGYISKLKMRIQRGLPDEHHNPCFLILLRQFEGLGEGIKKALEDFRAYEIIDEVTGIPAGDIFLKKMQMVHDAVSTGEITASLAIIQLNYYQTILNAHGQYCVDGLLKEISLRCRQTFRDVDILGYAGEGNFGVILLEADIHDAEIPLNRLRGLIANQPLFIPGNEDVIGTLSIACTAITPDVDVETSVQTCESALADGESGNNSIAQV